MTESPALIAEALDIRVGGTALIDKADLRVSPGEIVLLAGPSGSGKSVFLRLLGGLAGRGTPEFEVGGRLEVLGRDVLSHSRAARGRVGLVFQDFALFTGLSAGENVEFALAHRDPPPSRKEAKEDRRSLLAELKLAKGSRVATLSGGQKQRVAIARALAYRPKVLAYDEPTSGLDPATARDVGDLLKRTNRENGTTTIVVTHDLEGLLHIADRVLLLDPGRRRLFEVGLDEATEHLGRLSATPPPPQRVPGPGARVLGGVAGFFEGSFRAVEGLGAALAHLVPFWRSRTWGLRFLGRFLKMVAGPGALLYFLLAGAVIGLVASYFTFTFLPYPEYSRGLLLDDLIGALGFGLHRILVPLLIGILLAARAGAAVSAEISTRVAGGEDDAMRSFGAAPSRYLLTGTLWAFLLGTPIVAAVAYLGAEAASLVVFAAMAPDISLFGWDGMYHRLLETPGGLLPAGSGWVVGKYLAGAFGIGAIAYFRGARPKASPGDVARAITSTVIWATVLVLAIHTAFAMFEF